MSSLNEDDLRAIAESHDLYISPIREDGISYGTPTLVWPTKKNDDGEVESTFTRFKFVKCIFEHNQTQSGESLTGKRSLRLP